MTPFTKRSPDVDQSCTRVCGCVWLAVCVYLWYCHSDTLWLLDLLWDQKSWLHNNQSFQGRPMLCSSPLSVPSVMMRGKLRVWVIFEVTVIEVKTLIHLLIRNLSASPDWLLTVWHALFSPAQVRWVYFDRLQSSYDFFLFKRTTSNLTLCSLSELSCPCVSVLSTQRAEVKHNTGESLMAVW